MTERPNQRGGQRAGVYAWPELYDIVHAPGTAREIDGMLRVVRSAAGRSVLRADDVVWVEPGCGTGRYLRALKARGAHAVGFDLDKGMVRSARNGLRAARGSGECVALSGDMRLADAPALRRAVVRAARSAGKPRAMVAFNPHNSVRHLQTDEHLVEHLTSVARLMTATGGRKDAGGTIAVYLVGIGLMAPPGSAGGEQSCETVFTQSRGNVRVHEVTDFVVPDPRAKGDEARIERAYKHVSVFERVASRGRFPTEPTRELISSYVLRTYTPRQWQACVSAAGMREMGVYTSSGERLQASRLHYAWRVLTIGQATPGR